MNESKWTWLILDLLLVYVKNKMVLILYSCRIPQTLKYIQSSIFQSKYIFKIIYFVNFYTRRRLSFFLGGGCKGSMSDVAQYEHFVKILGWLELCIRWMSFSIFRQNLNFRWRALNSNPKFSCWSGKMASIGGCTQNFGLLSKFVEPNAAAYTKFGVTKCWIAPNR